VGGGEEIGLEAAAAGSANSDNRVPVLGSTQFFSSSGRVPSILDYPDKKKRERERERGGGSTPRARETAAEVYVVVVSRKVNYSKDLEREQSRRRQ